MHGFGDLLFFAVCVALSQSAGGAEMEGGSTLASVLRKALAKAEHQIALEGITEVNLSTARRPESIDLSLLTEEAYIRFPNVSHALEGLGKAYNGQATHAIYALGADTDFGNMGNDAIYGEVLPTTVVNMLQLVGGAPGMHYYDLGSGTGKTVLLASLLGLNATGVELAQSRWAISCDALRRAASHESLVDRGRLRFVHGSFLDVDMSDADVIFANSVMWSQDVKKQLGSTISRLRPGVKVISFGGFRGVGLDNVGVFNGPTCWSSDTQWTVQSVPTRLVQTGEATAAGCTHEHDACAW